MWSVLIFALLCLHIGAGSTGHIDDVRSHQKGYYQPIQNDDRELNSSPQQANNSPGEPENGKNPPAPQNSRNPKAPQNNQNQPSKACTKPKPFVKNAFKKCSTTTNTCTVQCFNNHQFANGKTSVKLLCNNGEWALENFQKTDKLACEVKKKNNCPNKPVTQQSEANCQSESCTITCEKGHTLPDGSPSMEMMCKDGEWVPANPEQSFPPICEPMCENGREYKECSKMSEQTCESVAEEGTSSSECFEGCFCPDGTVEHEGECIPKENCPCSLEGQMYESGSEAKKGSNTCKCEKGEWKCDARCEVFGDPHYITFDGKRYDFMGRCSYYLMRLPHMDVIAENGDCPWGHNEQVSCTKAIMMQVPHGQSSTMIRMDQGGRVSINGIDATRNLPMNLLSGFMHIRPVSQMARQVLCADGMSMMWDGYTYAYIDAPASHANKTNGLCGNFDNNPENDFTTPEGDAEVLPESFGEKWRVKEICDDEQEKNNVPHPCQANRQNQQQAINVCAKLKSNIFAACHQHVDPEPYIENCMYDMCACKGDAAQCKCTIFSAYANECSRYGKNINWRQTIKECAVKCPAEQIFQECDDLQSKAKKCAKKCVAGCQCPVGKALDASNKCIPIEKCPKEPESTEPTKTTKPTEATEATELNEPSEPEMSVNEPTKTPNLIRPTTSITPNRSGKPTKPTKPTKATRPTKPTTPTTPTKPTEPIEELEPNEPTELITLDEATEPNDVTDETEVDDITTDVSELNELGENTDATDIDEITEIDNNDDSPPKKTQEENDQNENEKNECSDEKNERMSICIPDEPKTCTNMNNYTSKPTGMCKSGCVCKDGYVLDKKLNQCVMPNFCSCTDKGKGYIFGAQIQNGCKTCICHGGEWYCRNTCKNKKDDDDRPDVDSEDASVGQDSSEQQENDENIEQKPNKDKQKPKKDQPKPTEDKPRKNRDNDENSCQPISMSESETIGLIEIYTQAYGRCINNKPIKGFAECSGLCNSKTEFNRATGRRDQKCGCCQVSESEKIDATVDCDDGSEQSMLISVPKSCSCQGCGGIGGETGNGNEYQNRNVEPTVDSTETGSRRRVNDWLFNLGNLVNSRNVRIRI